MTPDWLKATTAGDRQEVTSLLDAGADINSLDKHGQTALMNAARRGDTELVQLLVENGANLNHTAKYRLTALMLAVINGHKDIVKILANAGADTSLKGSPSRFAKTPLEYALAHGFDEIAVILKEYA